jgi:serpin B
MKKAILSIIVVAILITVSVFSINWIYNSRDFSSDSSPANVYELVNCSNDFSFEMYQKLAADETEENVFFSPYSITTALGMAYEGARGQTASEIAGVLNFPADNRTRLDMMKSYQGEFNRENTAYELSTANAYWLKQNEQLIELYREVIESYYLASGDELDFAGDPMGSAQAINNWVEEQTNGKIKNIIDPGMINDATFLILTNAIYFKSDWRYQFNSTSTENESFNMVDGESIIAEMMHMNDKEIKFNYSSNSDVQMLQLPYKKGELSMYVLLPKDNDMATQESNLDFEYLNALKDGMSEENVNLHFPKFKFEQKYILNDMLIDMGMPTAFNDTADFSGITDSTSLKIGFVIHQSFVEVNEKGTEAAAATVVGMVGTGVDPHPEPQPILFDANHPFIFFIEHEATGQILFMGKVGNPSA